MFIFQFHLMFKKFIAIATVLFFVGTPFRVDALGLSPPEVELGYIPVGSVQTVRAQISRAPNEMEGSLRITVTPRKSAAGFFFGESEVTLPEGTREVDYLFSIIPDYTQETQQELYVTFLLQSSSSSSGSVSVVTGVTQVMRFTTDVDTSSKPTTDLSITPILGGVGAGATCEAFRSDTGVVIGTALTGSSGKCVMTLPRSYSGVVVVRVKGGPGVKYYDERIGQLVDFSSEQAVFSVVAPSVWNTPLATVSTPVTTITTVVAAKAGVSLSAMATTVSAPALTESVITQAVADTLPIFGLSASDIDIFETPASTTFFQASDVGVEKMLSGDTSQLRYGVALQAVAYIAPSGMQLADFAQTLAQAVAENRVAEAVPTIANFQEAFQMAVETNVADGEDVGESPVASATVPSLSRSLSAVSGDGQAVISFTAPADNGGSTITSYLVTCVTSSGASVSATGTESPVTVRGLTNSKVYTCSIKASNAMGAGVSSSDVDVRPLAASGGGSAGSGQATSTKDQTVKTPSDKTVPSDIPKLIPDVNSLSIPSVQKEENAPIDTQPSVGVSEEAVSQQEPTKDVEMISKVPVQESWPWWMFWKDPSADADVGQEGESITEVGDAFLPVDVSTQTEQTQPSSKSIQSPTHPSEEAFVSNSDVTLFLRPTGTGENVPIRFLITTESTVGASELIQETNNPSISFHLPDGIYYVHTQEATDVSTPISTRRVMIDTTPPVVEPKVQSKWWALPFSASRNEIVLEVVDTLAGVAKVDVSIDGKTAEVVDGRISTRSLGWGTHSLVVDATDEAGNVIIQEFTVNVEPKYSIAHMLSRIVKAFNPFSWF